MNAESRFVQATKRLEILSSGSAHAVFASGVFYHQSCCIKFLMKSAKLPLKDNLQKNKAKDILDLYSNSE